MNLPADLQQSVDETRAIVRFRFPWWLRPFLMRGVAGITLGRRIYLDSGVSDVRRLLRHELVHVRQIQRLGVLRFYATYARDYVRNRRRGWSPAEAYRRIPLEIQAFAAEEEESV
jgi:hypothetical protein